MSEKRKLLVIGLGGFDQPILNNANYAGFSEAWDITRVEVIEKAMIELRDGGYDICLVSDNARHDGLTTLSYIKEVECDTPLIWHYDSFDDEKYRTACRYGVVGCVSNSLSSLAELPQRLDALAIEAEIRREINQDLELAIKDARHDPLTGLLNMRGFQVVSEDFFEQAKEQGITDAVIFFDLNDLTNINSDYGHAGGNRALVAIANRLRANLGEGDLLARPGGDEFCAYISMSKADNAEVLVGQIMERIAKAGEVPVEVASGVHRNIYVSMGAALMDPNASETLDNYIRRADGAAYYAKRTFKSALSGYGDPGNVKPYALFDPSNPNHLIKPGTYKNPKRPIVVQSLKRD